MNRRAGVPDMFCWAVFTAPIADDVMRGSGAQNKRPWRARLQANGHLVLVALIALLPASIAALSASASANSQYDWKAAQREAEMRRREAERQRREAEQRRREAIRQRQEALRQQREAQRQKQLAEQRARQQQLQQQKQAQAQKQAQQQAQQKSAQQKAQSSTQTKTPQAAAKTANPAAKSASKGQQPNQANSQSQNPGKGQQAASNNNDAAHDPENPNRAGEAADIDTLDAASAGPPPTMEKLLKNWFAPKQPPQPPAPLAKPEQQPALELQALWQHQKNARRLQLQKQLQNESRQAIDAAKPAATTLSTWTKGTSTVPARLQQQETRAAQSPHNNRSDAVTSITDAVAPADAEPAPIAQKVPIGRPPPLELGLPPAPELLAVNASPKSIEHARKLGFRIGRQSKFSKLNLAVTRVVAPKGMSPARARSLLQSKFPEISFEHNQKYRIYKTATGVDDVKQPTALNGSRPATAPNQTPVCTGEHCFPTQMIGWKPDLNRCATGTRIGIIDTSVDLKHPAFAGRKLTVSHFGRNDPPEPDWHGTGVAAILAGNSNSGTPGLIPGANFYLADVFYADDDGQPASDTESMLRAFDWMEAKGVKIINMSLSGPRDELIKQAIAKLSAKGIVLVAAAGNDGPAATPSYPAAYDDVIAVTAVNKNLRSYRYANRGSYIDVAAPGVGIWTALPDARQGFHSGTSFATPYITATLATMVARYPRANAASLLQKLSFQDLGDPGPDPVYGMGLVRAPASCGGSAVAQAVVTGSTPQKSSRPSFAPASAARGGEVLPWLGLNQ